MYSNAYLFTSTQTYTWAPGSNNVILVTTAGTIILPDLPVTGNNSCELLIYKIAAGNLIISSNMNIRYLPTNANGASFTITTANNRIACRWIPSYPITTQGYWIISVTT